MRKLVRMAFLPGLIVGVFLAFGSVSAKAEDSDSKLTVSGQGEALASPDMAVVSLGVIAQARSAKAAMDQVSEQLGTILARLERTGIAARDLQTSDLRLSPQYARNTGNLEPRRIVSYEAANTLSVRIRDLDQLGGVLDQALTDGANQLYGLRFEVAEPAPLIEEARASAVKDAVSKAKLYARAAGVELGRLLSLSEAGSVSPRATPMMEMRMAADAVSVAAGEVGLSARVTLVYEILN
ncbi:MAG: SIMPL domain-containing protein [Pseudomonadota bacterium]